MVQIQNFYFYFPGNGGLVNHIFFVDAGLALPDGEVVYHLGVPLGNLHKLFLCYEELSLLAAPVLPDLQCLQRAESPERGENKGQESYVVG